MISPEYLPNPAQRLAAQYHRVGVSSVRWDISGARSVVEVLPGQVNGYNAAQAIYRSGFRGCWVIALGTNDTADVAVGSNVGLMTRIQRMMAAAHGEPVMWVNLRSLLASGPYSEANMVTWDNTLLKACAKYPNMRVFNWAALAKTKWYISDGIHFTSDGLRGPRPADRPGPGPGLPEDRPERRLRRQLARASGPDQGEAPAPARPSQPDPPNQARPRAGAERAASARGRFHAGASTGLHHGTPSRDPSRAPGPVVRPGRCPCGTARRRPRRR